MQKCEQESDELWQRETKVLTMKDVTWRGAGTVGEQRKTQVTWKYGITRCHFCPVKALTSQCRVFPEKNLHMNRSYFSRDAWNSRLH